MILSNHKCTNIVPFIQPCILDTKLRVLSGYGGLKEDLATRNQMPLLQVLLTEIDTDNQIIPNSILITHIKFNSLHRAKIGSYWKGTQYFSIKKNLSASIVHQYLNLEINHVTSSKSISSLRSSEIELINNINKYHHFNHRNLRQYTIPSNYMTFIVDSIQFIDALLPKGEHVRKLLLFSSIQNIISYYLKESKYSSHDKNDYLITKRLRSNPISNKNLDFIANLASNVSIQDIISRFQMSLHDINFEDFKTKQYQRFPILDLPVGQLSFFAEGVWLDDNCFYVTNILKISSNPFFKSKYTLIIK